jgi:tetratricopeptide (TPR) repeat protein
VGGQSFNEQSLEIDLLTLQAPVKIGGLGQSHIAITTKSSEAQQWFDQGLALLHCFWDYEALRAFRQTIRLDPDCALCHWGLYRALTFGMREKAAKAELAKAKDLIVKASELERFYILAAVNEQEDKEKGKETTTAYRDQMQKLIDRYPVDVEAKLFLIDGGLDWGYKPDGEPRPDTIYTQSLLREILHSDPRNTAANHYHIHAVESGKHPEWALESADRLGKLSPASSHMVHMPGHIYYRVGDYEKARQTFLAALKVDEDYMQRQHVSPRDNWNYAHNISYLISACVEAGRMAEAEARLARLQGLADNPDGSNNPPFYVFQIAATGARLNLRFAQWQHVIDHPLAFGVADSGLNPFAKAYLDGLVAYARGMKALENGDPARAARESDELDALLWRTSQKDPGEKQDGMQRSVGRILSVASFELRGNIASGRNQFEQARDLLREAAKKEREMGYAEPPQYSRPALESLGYACIRADWDDAREAFQQVLDERPNSGFGLYGIALAYDKQGDRENAGIAYRAFLNAWVNADRHLPQVEAARQFPMKQAPR